MLSLKRGGDSGDEQKAVSRVYLWSQNDCDAGRERDMAKETDHEHPAVDAITAEEAAAGMTDEQLFNARDAVTDCENLTDVEDAVIAEIERRERNI